LQQQKLAAETKRAAAMATLAEHKVRIASGEYLLTSDHEAELAARAQLFRSDLRNFARATVGDIIPLVEGNMDRAPDLMQFLLDHVDELLDRYARETQFEVSDTLTP
jgi:hypothetical protein